MTKKRTIIFILGILIAIVLGAAVSIYLSFQKKQTIGKTTISQKIETPHAPTLTPTPFPTTPPMPHKVKGIDDRYIVISSTEGGGDMYEPKDPSHLTVYKMRNGQKIPATFEDVKVGQSVSLTIIIPGKKAELVIEE